MSSADHPRPRGEHLWTMRVSVGRSGSPPPTRGTPGIAPKRRIVPRITPAHAGNTWNRPPDLRCSTDHPRPRGEHGCGTINRRVMCGSPPPTRGTLLKQHALKQQARITPAHAGNTHPAVFSAHFYADHPRPRGEHAPSRRVPRSLSGSPPPTRGTRAAEVAAEGLIRITPAHAGNTSEHHHPVKQRSDHPRPRGEHAPNSLYSGSNCGSPPPTRGTQAQACYQAATYRITPAHAGNTSCRWT